MEILVKIKKYEIGKIKMLRDDLIVQIPITHELGEYTNGTLLKWDIEDIGSFIGLYELNDDGEVQYYLIDSKRASSCKNGVYNLATIEDVKEYEIIKKHLMY